MLRSLYPEKEVIIVETGYPWTMDWNDNASNIINETHPDYHPATPGSQKQFLVDLTREIISSGGSGVIYWEPAWVSSPCHTQWGQGSHQEHATFFDFDNNLILPGGIQWMEENYEETLSVQEENVDQEILVFTNSFSGDITIKQLKDPRKISYQVSDTIGKIVVRGMSHDDEIRISVKDQPFGIYNILLSGKEGRLANKAFLYQPD